MNIKRNPGKADTMSGHQNKQPSASRNIPQSLSPNIALPLHIFQKLLKVGAFWGIPGQLLGESEITKLVVRNWDRKNSRPRRVNAK